MIQIILKHIVVIKILLPAKDKTLAISPPALRFHFPVKLLLEKTLQIFKKNIKWKSHIGLIFILSDL